VREARWRLQVSRSTPPAFDSCPPAPPPFRGPESAPLLRHSLLLRLPADVDEEKDDVIPGLVRGPLEALLSPIDSVWEGE